ncbi:Protein CBG04914 [Caenorhabditis briggsae]|uniref:Protein CBG04914 n=1 Tax=Caenorhabditis briggsae TaxID=6238 RepID=A8WYS9_CAEBR|nr:Protein CBG04914 [Caenorhabditis briggsae]CAP25537.1 Protein CBG04914 [Caenorhabditis briggsae]
MSSFKLLKYPTLVQKEIIEEMNIRERFFFSALSANACSRFMHLGVRKIVVYDMQLNVSRTNTEIRLNTSSGYLSFNIFYYTKLDHMMNFRLDKTSVPVSVGEYSCQFSFADYSAGKMKAVVELIGKLTKQLSCISNIELCNIKYTHPVTSLFPNLHGIQKFGNVDICNYAGSEKGVKLTAEDFDVISNSKFVKILCSISGVQKTVNTFLKAWISGNHTASGIAHFYAIMHSNKKITEFFTGIETTVSTTTVAEINSIKNEWLDQWTVFDGTVDIHRQSDQMRATVAFHNTGHRVLFVVWNEENLAKLPRTQ